MTMTETKTYKKTNTKTKTHRQRQIQSASKTQCMLYSLKAGGSRISNIAFPPKIPLCWIMEDLIMFTVLHRLRNWHQHPSSLDSKVHFCQHCLSAKLYKCPLSIFIVWYNSGHIFNKLMTVYLKLEQQEIFALYSIVSGQLIQLWGLFWKTPVEAGKATTSLSCSAWQPPKNTLWQPNRFSTDGRHDAALDADAC